MGNYDSQYENYYSSMMKRNGYAKKNIRRDRNNFSKNIFVKRILQELAGVLILIFIVLICKFYKNPQTSMIYTYLKQQVNRSYNYDEIYNKIITFDPNSVESELEDYIDKFKMNMGLGISLEEKVKQNYVPPVQGKILASDSKGAKVSSDKKTDVKCCFDGTVESVGNDSKLGNYVSVDHGDGIETQYYSLENVSVKKGQKLKKGDTLGSSSQIYFKFLYMGEERDPKEYFNF
ncbi:M23 family metallopeptidase [Clostridium sp. 19966]|uniref:M23 family metallopeptidase n=1 Tax=Clostridium sp. 19966 TaxID=2768166 RepID=UPI0028DD7ED7|nr:M23 family metallopeptidase [Clostridium sp. 19966]MDT8715280.1 M23 family metallopeptidase [Clostridium sp. 19966]